MKNPFHFVPSDAHQAKALERNATNSVQTSLFARLGKSYPHTRGKIAWLLVWAGTPSSKNHRDSVDCLSAIPNEERAGLRATVESCRDAPGRESDHGWQTIVRRILDALVAADHPQPSPASLVSSGGRASSAPVLDFTAAAAAAGPRMARYNDLVAGGMGDSEAADQAIQEFP